MAAKLTRYAPTYKGDVFDARGRLGALIAIVVATPDAVRITTASEGDQNYTSTTLELSVDAAAALAVSLEDAVAEARIARQQAGWHELARATAGATHAA